MLRRALSWRWLVALPLLASILWLRTQSSLRARVWTQRLTRIALYGFVVVLLLRGC